MVQYAVCSSQGLTNLTGTKHCSPRLIAGEGTPVERKTIAVREGVLSKKLSARRSAISLLRGVHWGNSEVSFTPGAARYQACACDRSEASSVPERVRAAYL